MPAFGAGGVMMQQGQGTRLPFPVQKGGDSLPGLVSRLVKLVQRLPVPGQRIHATGVLRGNNQDLALFGVFPSQRYALVVTLCPLA